MAKEIGNWGKAPRADQSGPTVPTWTDDSRAVIEPLLEPGETLLWSSRGKGPYLRARTIYSIAFLSVFAPLTLFSLIRSGMDGSVPVAALVYAGGICISVTSLLGFLSIRALLATAYDRYGLTTRRLIVVERFWPRTVRSYGPKAKYIDLLEVHHGRTREIRLRKPRSRGALRPFALVGISEPQKVAELIKSTLKLELPVTDDSLHIPPLEPRRP